MINVREVMDALRWLDDAAITEALLRDCRNGLHQEADSRLVQAMHASFGAPLPLVWIASRAFQKELARLEASGDGRQRDAM
jgi:hypothetical protein